MGKEIVYCEGCGTNLREADFTKGTAHTFENKPYCTTCKPKAAAAAAPPPATPSKTGTGRIPLQKPPSTRKSATGRVPTATVGGRRGAPPPVRKPSHLPLILIGVGIGVALIVLITFVLSRRAPRTSSGSERSTAPFSDRSGGLRST